jgi:HTH-type transcriptional regulator / antitoxin HigA
MKPIKDENTYQSSLKRIEELWGAKPDTPEGDELDILLIMVEAYEEKHYPIPASNPVDAILFRMEQMDMNRKDLEQFLGPKSRVSDVLNRKRPLSLPQIKKLHKEMGIPYESLIDTK